MTQEERRIYLIRQLLEEEPRYCDMPLPTQEEAQKKLLRALMNVRPPRPVDAEFLRIQDEYLRRETAAKGVTDAGDLQGAPGNSRLVLRQGDITALRADAIVNAANSGLRGCFVPCHSCVDNIIHSVSGIQLRLFCDRLMSQQGHEEPVGKAKITPAFNLPCRYVLHTVGPVVTGPLTTKHCRQLTDCYRSCLKLASENGVRSIAFCCISTGEFHFPQKTAAQIAVRTVTDFLQTDVSIERVIFNVYKREDYDIYKQILGETRKL